MTTTSQRLDFLLGILKETPTDSFVIFAIAKEYENIGNQNEAIQYYHNLYQIDPDYVGLYFAPGTPVGKRTTKMGPYRGVKHRENYLLHLLKLRDGGFNA